MQLEILLVSHTYLDPAGKSFNACNNNLRPCYATQPVRVQSCYVMLTANLSRSFARKTPAPSKQFQTKQFSKLNKKKVEFRL